MMKIVEAKSDKVATVVILDEVNCKIFHLEPKHTRFLQNQYSFFVEGYQFSVKFQIGVWDGKVSFFKADGSTHNLLLDEIIPILKSFDYRIVVQDKREGDFIPISPIDRLHFYHCAFPNGENCIIRPYQVDAINSVLVEGRGIILAGTGAGKSTIGATLIDVYGNKGLRTLTVVPSLSLIAQSLKSYSETFQLDVGELSGTTKDLNHPHIISTWQSLQNVPTILKDFQVIVVDECHQVKASILSKLLNVHGKNIVYRFGLTGTMPKLPMDELAVKISLGTVKYTVEAHELITQGWLAKPNITIVQLDDIQRLQSLEVDTNKKIVFDSENHFMQTDPVRLQYIAEYVTRLGTNSHKGNVLCLVNNIALGKKLSKLVPDSYFLYGKDSQIIRQQVYDLFENSDNLTVFCTAQIAGVGLSIDRIFNLVYIDVGKSYIKVIQAIGRGLRKSKDKDTVEITDLCGNLDYSKEHLRKRVRFYKEAKYDFQKIVKQYANNYEV